MYLTYKHKDNIIQILVMGNTLQGIRANVTKPNNGKKGTIELLSILDHNACGSLLHTYSLRTVKGKDMPQLFRLTLGGALIPNEEYDFITGSQEPKYSIKRLNLRYL